MTKSEIMKMIIGIITKNDKLNICIFFVKSTLPVINRQELMANWNEILAPLIVSDITRRF